MSKKEQKQKAKQILPEKKMPVTWLSVLLVVFSFLLYSNTINHDFALDDDIYTKKNTFVQQGLSAVSDVFTKGSLVGFNGSNDSNYRPLVLFNFLVETTIFGTNAHVHHFFNIVFFCISILLVYKLFRKLLPEVHPSIPFISALLFAAHPIHTEVVANIKSRDEILGLMFGLLSFNFIIDYWDSKKIKDILLSCLFFFFASLCKENSLTFAFIIPMMLYFFRRASILQSIKLATPYIGLAVLYMLIRSSVLDSVTFKEQMVVMNNSLMAAKTAGEMYATNFVMMGKYLILLFLPHPLSWDYSFSQFPIVGWSSPLALLSVAVYAALIVFALIQLKNRNIFAFAILFFLTTIFLSSNLVVKIGSSFAERFLYTPSLAFCLVLPILLAKIFKTDTLKSTFSGSKVITVSAVILVLFAGKTYSRNKDWKDNLTLFTSGLETSPNSARVHYSYASECRTRGEQSPNPSDKQKYFNEAVREFNVGLQIYPESDAYYNLGVTYFNMGDNVKAMECYNKTVELRDDFTPALNNIGVIHFIDKKYKEAEKYFRLVLKNDSNYADAYANLGAIFQNEGKFPDAIKSYDQALKRNPRNKNVYQNLSKLYFSTGDTLKGKQFALQADQVR